jgi:hypothetical protein
LEGSVAALLRRGTETQGKALAAIAPRDLMIALDELVEAVGTQHPAAFHLFLIVFGSPGFLPEPAGRFPRVESDGIGYGGQDLLEYPGHGDKHALEHGVAAAIGPWQVAHAAVDARSVAGDQFRRVRLGPIRAIPVQPDAGKHVVRAGAREQNARMRAAAVSEIGHGDEPRLREVRELAEVQVRGLAGTIEHVDDERFLPEPESQFGAVGVAGGKRATIERDLGRGRWAVGGVARRSHTRAGQEIAHIGAVYLSEEPAQTRLGIEKVNDAAVLALVGEPEQRGAAADFDPVFEFRGRALRQDRLLARRKREPSRTGVGPGRLAGEQGEAALGARGETEGRKLLAVKANRVEIQFAPSRLPPAAEFKRFTMNGRLETRPQPMVNQPPFLPADLAQVQRGGLARGIAQVNGEPDRGCVGRIHPTPAVAVHPKVHGIGVCWQAQGLRRDQAQARDRVGLAGAAVAQPGHRTVPDVLGAGRLERGLGIPGGFKPPTRQLVETSRGRRGFVTVSPGHFIRALARRFGRFEFGNDRLRDRHGQQHGGGEHQ